LLGADNSQTQAARQLAPPPISGPPRAARGSTRIGTCATTWSCRPTCRC